MTGIKSEHLTVSRAPYFILTTEPWFNSSLSRTCDRLAEIFRRADQSGVPDHAVNVFLLVNRFEQFDGVDVTVLGSDSCNIPGEELKRIVRCLESRSASSLG